MKTKKKVAPKKKIAKKTVAPQAIAPDTVELEAMSKCLSHLIVIDEKDALFSPQAREGLLQILEMLDLTTLHKVIDKNTPDPTGVSKDFDRFLIGVLKPQAAVAEKIDRLELQIKAVTKALLQHVTQKNPTP